MHKPKQYTDKNAAISSRQKLQTMCKNVEISDAQIQRKRRSLLVSLCTWKKAQLQLQEATKWNYYKATGDVYHPHKKQAAKMDEEKEEREGKQQYGNALFLMKKTCHGKQHWGDVYIKNVTPGQQRGLIQTHLHNNWAKCTPLYPNLKQ